MEKTMLDRYTAFEISMSNAHTKTSRICAALEHVETDRVPVGEFFWTNFIRRARREGHTGEGFDRAAIGMLPL